MTKKFRIWDGEKFYFTTDKVDIYPAGLSDTFGLFFEITPNERLKPNPRDYSKSAKITIQQWTGLTDSQGVEIYEGDFVKAGAIKGKINFYKSAYYINEQLLIDVYVLLAGNIKIIGNIFQTPELLEKC